MISPEVAPVRPRIVSPDTGDALLLGAKVSGVDFYLVDLRDAIYGESQLRQFVRTGAIL